VSARLWLELLVACSSPPADRLAYTEGLRADTYEAARAACARVGDAEERGDCQTAAAERFLRFEDCGTIEVARWRDECVFVQSESLGRSGDLVGALQACKGSAFAAQCDDHVLGLLAGAHLSEDTARLAEALDAVRPHLSSTRGEGQMWAHYFRNRVARGLEVRVDDCPRGPCLPMAEREVSAATRELFLAMDPTEACAAPPPAVPWATTEVVREWMRQQQVRQCSGGGAGGPGGPRGAPPGGGSGPAPAGSPG